MPVQLSVAQPMSKIMNASGKHPASKKNRTILALSLPP